MADASFDGMRDDMMSVSDVVSEGWASRSSVYRYIEAGHIPYYRVGGHYRFRRSELETFFKGYRGALARSKAQEILDLPCFAGVGDRDGALADVTNVLLDVAHGGAVDE